MFNNFLQSYSAFENHGVENPLLETVRLFDILSRGSLRSTDLSFLEKENIDLLHVVKKRKEGIPLEYIIKKASFLGQMFICTQDTLIPTEETKLLVEVASDLIKKREEVEDDLTVIDVGTGCGNIAICLAMNSRHAKILASDISPASVEVARKNVLTFQLQDRISLLCGDMFSPFQGLGCEGRIDIIVCNPPYIPTGSFDRLPREIRDHEPRIALDGGPYGINIYRRLIKDALPMLKAEGVLVFEIGERQENLVKRLIEKNDGYGDIRYFMHGTNVRTVSAVKRKI
jgi:release factor glutamine methyltransferase